MNAHPQLGPISEMGRRYLAGDLHGRTLSGSLQLSREGDIPLLQSLPIDQRQTLQQLGKAALADRVAFGVLAAGASSRMAPQQLPQRCREMLAESGRDSLPASKAMVPVFQSGKQVLTFLDLFLNNVTQFRRQLGINNPAYLLVSEANGEEIESHLQQAGVGNVRTFRQPLAPQIAATPDDVRRAQNNFADEQAYRAALARAEAWQGHEVLVPKPAGHGEFLHQLIASGMLGELAAEGVELLTIRNIDNAAALLDDAWLTLLGHMDREQLDFLLEVCPRLPGQKGGALVCEDGRWQIAEDPSFIGTDYRGQDSFYINNAVAIFRTRYLFQLYDTSLEELQSASPQRRQEIADQGRRKFPVIVEAKPVLLDDGSVVGAITPETNLWESTEVVEGVRIGAIAVPSEASLGEDFLQQPAAQQAEAAGQVRFSPTKTWADYEDPVKQAILNGLARKILKAEPT